MNPKEYFLDNFSYDSAFGHWEGRLRMAWWGRRPLEVWVEAGEDGPTDRHLQLLRSIMEYRGSLLEQIQDKVYAYYKENAASMTYNCPNVARPAQIWKCLDPPSLVVLPPASDGIVFLLIMECDWDSEHGLGIRIKNWSVVDIGGQSDVSYDE
jgi:hypothetical protein